MGMLNSITGIFSKNVRLYGESIGKAKNGIKVYKNGDTITSIKDGQIFKQIKKEILCKEDDYTKTIGHRTSVEDFADKTSTYIYNGKCTFAPHVKDFSWLGRYFYGGETLKIRELGKYKTDENGVSNLIKHEDHFKSDDWTRDVIEKPHITKEVSEFKNTKKTTEIYLNKLKYGGEIKSGSICQSEYFYSDGTKHTSFGNWIKKA